MRILLNQSLPHGLAALIAGHDVSTVSDEGWKSVKMKLPARSLCKVGA
jgi:hypothetical protein